MKRRKSFWDIFNPFSRHDKEVKIRAIVVHSHEDALWTVQGLEYDITAQGDTPEEALHAFGHLLCSWIVLDLEKHREPFSALPEAPQKYWEMFERTNVTLQAPFEDNIVKFPRLNFIPKQELRLCA